MYRQANPYIYMACKVLFFCAWCLEAVHYISHGNANTNHEYQLDGFAVIPKTNVAGIDAVRDGHSDLIASRAAQSGGDSVHNGHESQNLEPAYGSQWMVFVAHA